MAEFTVEWLIELDADDPRDAALKALAIHRDPESIADVFTVTGADGVVHRVDLSEEDER